MIALVTLVVAVIILSTSLLISGQSSSSSAAALSSASVASTSTISSSASVSVASPSSISSSSLDYNNIITAISSMNDKDKATILEAVLEVVGTTSISTTSTTISSNDSTSNTNSSIEYDHRKLNRLLQSSSSIKVTGGCDDQIIIYVNGVQVSQPAYYNPSTDTLAIRGLDWGGYYWCRIYFNDAELPVSTVNNHFKCTYKDNYQDDLPAGWMDKDYDDSTWGDVYTTPWGGWWAEGLTHDYGGIFCRYHNEGSICKDGSEPYGGQCWCGYGYKSSTGLAPCEPCDDNSFTDALGSTMCKCAANAFSINGYDSPNSCKSCPG